MNIAPGALIPVNINMMSRTAIGLPMPTVVAAVIPATSATVVGVPGKNAIAARLATAPANINGNAAPPRQPLDKQIASANAFKKPSPRSAVHAVF